MYMEFFSSKLTTTDLATHTSTPQPRWDSKLISKLSIYFRFSTFPQRFIHSWHLLIFSVCVLFHRFLSVHCSTPNMSASSPLPFHIMPVPSLWWQDSLSSVSSFCIWEKKRSLIKMSTSNEKYKKMMKKKMCSRPLAVMRSDFVGMGSFWWVGWCAITKKKKKL